MVSPRNRQYGDGTGDSGVPGLNESRKLDNALSMSTTSKRVPIVLTTLKRCVFENVTSGRNKPSFANKADDAQSFKIVKKQVNEKLRDLRRSHGG